MRPLNFKPIVRDHAEQLCPLLLLNPVVAEFQLTSTRPLGIFSDCFRSRFARFPDCLSSKLELEPPSVAPLVDTHTPPRFVFFPLPFGLPPNFPFSRAISCSRSIPNRSSRAL